MNELDDLLHAQKEAELKGLNYALATVIQVNGSAYRRPGAKMLIYENGHWFGAISGGCLEGDALRKAREVMQNQTPRIIRYDTVNEDSAKRLGIGLGCEGIIDILLEPASAALREFFEFLDQRSPHKEALIRTHFEEKERSIRRSFEECEPGMPFKNSYERAGSLHQFTEIIKLPIHLLVFGAGPDALPVVECAKTLGWKVSINDDCPAHLIPRRFACADDMICGSPDGVIRKHPMHYRSAALIMSHNFEFDQAALKALLPEQVPYIGLLGPKKRAHKLLERLEQDGFRVNEEDHARLFAPVGLDLGAETAQEIALSIIAEIMAFFQGGSGVFLREKKGRIHERIS
jgi:xanthine/CO dehydrogenase XdhC/CoxF family maturation factor